VNRVREAVGHERRDCPTCLGNTNYTLYESFSRGWLGRRRETRLSAVCDHCGYKTVDEHRSVHLPD
jgi:C4-type Zn-finger protein